MQRTRTLAPVAPLPTCLKHAGAAAKSMRSTERSEAAANTASQELRRQRPHQRLAELLPGRPESAFTDRVI